MCFDRLVNYRDVGEGDMPHLYLKYYEHCARSGVNLFEERFADYLVEITTKKYLHQSSEMYDKN